MKIIVVSKHRIVNGEASLTRIYSMLDALVKLYGGNAVEWINVCDVEIANKNERNIALDRYSFQGCKTIVHFRNSFKNALLRSASFKISQALLYIHLYFAYRKSKKMLFWVEMSHSYSMIKSFVRFFRHNLIVDIHGTVDERINLALHKDENIDSYLNALRHEISCLWDAKGILGVSNQMIKFYKSKYASISDNTLVVPTTPDLSMFQYSENTRRKYREKILDNDDDFLMVYSGGIQKYQCIDELLIFFDKASNCTILKGCRLKLLLLIWDASFSLKEKCDSLKISSENMYHYRLAYEEVPKFLQAADLGIVLRKNITTNIVASPTKIGEYLYSGLPILGSPCLGDIKDLIQDYNIGYQYDIEKKIDMASFWEFCQSVIHKRSEYTSRCIDAARNYYSFRNFEKIRLLIDNTYYQ